MALPDDWSNKPAMDALYAPFESDSARVLTIEDQTAWKVLFSHFSLQEPQVDFNQYRAVAVVNSPDQVYRRSAGIVGVYDEGGEFSAYIEIHDSSQVPVSSAVILAPALNYVLVPRIKPMKIFVDTVILK